MVDDIAVLLEALESDSARCPVHPSSAIRRRGDRRRTAVRVAATGGTVALVGATAGTAFAVAQQPSPPHDTRIGIAGQTSSSPHPSDQIPVLREQLRRLIAQENVVVRREARAPDHAAKEVQMAQFASLRVREEALRAQLAAEGHANRGAAGTATPTASPGSGLSELPTPPPDQPTPSPTPHSS